MQVDIPYMGAYGNHTPIWEGVNSVICIDLFMDLPTFKYTMHLLYII